MLDVVARDKSPAFFFLIFLISIKDLIGNIQSHYEIYSVLLPVCTMSTAVKAVFKYCDRTSGCDSNPHSHSACSIHFTAGKFVMRHKEGVITGSFYSYVDVWETGGSYATNSLH